MKNVKIEIKVDGAAFDPPNTTNEIERVMDEAKQKIQKVRYYGHDEVKLLDINGNSCGTLTVNYPETEG